MDYFQIYKTPKQFDDIVMISDGYVLTGLYFQNSKDSKKHSGKLTEKQLPIFKQTADWLNHYFAGKQTEEVPHYKVLNLTPFRQLVIEEMLKMPYGKTVSYGDIAKQIACKKGIAKMSAQAVGGAVGFNPICLIIPCHRVVGTNGSLTGYGGGIENKKELLKLENQFSK